MNERGFTLLEAMVGLVIVAVAFPILLNLRNFDVGLIHRARMLTQATLLAQKKVMETELVGFLPVGEENGDFLHAHDEGEPVNVVMDRDVDFRWTRHVNSTPFERVREVRIRVSWSDKDKEDGIEVTTYVFAPISR